MNTGFKQATEEQHQSCIQINKFEREEKQTLNRQMPIWRSPYSVEISEPPQYKPVKPILTPKPNSTPKPILTPTTGRSSVYSIDPSPIMLDEIQKPHRFTSTVEQLNQMAQENQVHRPKPVAARPTHDSTQYYTATADAPFTTNNHTHIQQQQETVCRRMEVTEQMECSEQHYMNISKNVTMYDNRLSSQRSLGRSLESLPRPIPHHPHQSSQPNPLNQPNQTQYTQQAKVPPPPTPTRFIPGEFRESDYDSGNEAFKIRPMWTPHHFDAENDDNLRFRHVNAPTPSRCVSLESEFLIFKL